MDVCFNFLTRKISGKPEFIYNVVQRAADTDNALGGEQYVIRIPSRNLFLADGGDDKRILKDSPVILQAQSISEDAIYN